MISSFWIILYTENGVIVTHYLENAVILKGQSRVVEFAALPVQKYGNRTVDLVELFKANGIRVEVHYSVNGLADEAFVDPRQFPAVIQ